MWPGKRQRQMQTARPQRADSSDSSRRPWRLALSVAVLAAGASAWSSTAWASKPLEQSVPLAKGHGEALAQDNPARAAKRFLRAYQPLAATGMPKPPQLAALRPHLHPALRASLEEVSAQQATSACEGPPAIQGDLITSLAEGPNEFRVLACRIRAGTATCPVRFTYRGTPEGVRWTDEIELRLQADRWVVQDVVQGAPWSGHSRLSSRLAEASTVLRTCR